MKIFVEAFVDAPDKVTSVKTFVSFIYFMEAFVESFVDASVQISSVKASITSAEFLPLLS